MSEPDPPRATGAPLSNGTESWMASRRGLRDLAALLSLPAMWFDHDPAYIVTGLTGVLSGMLRLESCYVRFDDPANGPALVRWQPDGPGVPMALETVLTTDPARERGGATVSVMMPSGNSTIRVTSMFPTLPGEDGLVLVGSRRPDFPTELELHLLRVAVGQAAISIHTARRLTGERAARVAAEAALHHRNAFLASLAQDLTASLATVAERAAQARAFATNSDRAAAHVGGLTDIALVASAAAPAVADVALATSSARLSRREAEVLGLLAQGLSNREIAGVLWLSERTVERHITGLYRKIGVERRSEATAFAMRHGLADADAFVK